MLKIVSHLKPLDILQLARTSIAFRNMLMSRTSRHIWIASRRNVVPKLPDCPADISEPMYASLVFERTCQVSTCPAPWPRHSKPLPAMWCQSCYEL